MRPSATAWVPWYKPHNKAALVAMMMKATRPERIRLRLAAVAKALSVELMKRWVSRSSAV